MSMDLREESSKLESLAATTSRRLSSASSAFFSANQSPFFSPRSPKSLISELNLCCDVPTEDVSSSIKDTAVKDGSVNPASQVANDLQMLERASSSAGVSNDTASSHSQGHFIDYCRRRERRRKVERNHGMPFHSTVASPSSSRIWKCDIYIGLHGRKSSLLRFANWFKAELELQGISCFASDRARCRNSRKHRVVEKAMDFASFGVIIMTKKSFKNPYTVEELRFFSNKKNLVPVFFDLGPDDCLVRDIIERRGDVWETNGGELWTFYGGLEKEWKEAVYGLSRVDDWKLEAQNGSWRDCILSAVTLLAMRLGRRSISERLSKWKEKVNREEFPFPRSDNFIGRNKELTELEFILFGDVSGDSERDYFDLEAKPKRKQVKISWSRSGSVKEKQKDAKDGKGEEPVVWKESEKEIEMQNMNFPPRPNHSFKSRSSGKYGRRKRTKKIMYGKGIACVSGESGIGKTELLLEFAYRYHQRYKMVLWIGGESRYIRQNYLNLWPFLEVDIGIENFVEKSQTKSFEEQEEAAISRVRRELMRNIPYLVIIDNLESEKDWWDRKLVMDLLPRFGCETHCIISTRMASVMNLEPMKLSYLSGVEAMSLMQEGLREVSLPEIDALRVIEEKLGRITLGLAIVRAILSEIPISPTRLLDTINRMPLWDYSWSSGKEDNASRKNTFLLQLFEVCFSIFDHADGPRSLATRIVGASGWFAPGPIPVSLLVLTANQIPEKHRGTRFWKRFSRSFPCGFGYEKRSEAEATSMLLRFNMARSSTKQDHIYFNELVKLCARRRSVTGAAQAMVQSVISRASSLQLSQHLWAACFLVFGFGHDDVVVELKPSDLLILVREVVLPLAIRTFLTFSRCNAALDLLRLCTNALEAADQVLVAPAEKSLCWRPVQSSAQLNPSLWQDLALVRSSVLEIRAKLMLRGGQFDIGDDLIRKTIFIRTSICGENHPDTLSAKKTLDKLARLQANVQRANTTS